VSVPGTHRAAGTVLSRPAAPPLPLPLPAADAGPAGHSLLERWGRAVARHHRLVLILWLEFLLGGAAMYPALQSHLATPDYAVHGGGAASARELLAAHFTALGAEQDVVVFRSSRYVVTDAAYRQVVGTVLYVVQSEADVASVVSPYNTLSGGQLSPDHHVALALVGVRNNAAARARLAASLQVMISQRVAGSDIEAYFTGSSPLSNDISRVQLHDQDDAESFGVPLALVVLLLAMGGVVAAALPVVLALAAVLACFWILGMLSIPLHLDQFVMVVTTMIGVGVGIDYALFVVSRFTENLAKRFPPGSDPPDHAALVEAVGVALDTSGRTVLTSGAVVIVAMGSMIVMRGHIFVEITVATGLVVTCCVCAAVTLLPALLMTLGGRVNSGALPTRFRPAYLGTGGSGLSSWSARWAGFVMRHPLRIGLPALALLCLTALPLTGVRLGLDLGVNSLRHAPSGRGVRLVAASFGQGMVGPAQLVICASGPSLDTADLHGLARLEAALRADPRVARIASATDLLDATVGGNTSADLARAAARGDLRPALSRVIDLDSGGRCALAEAVPAVPVDSRAATDLVHDIRARVGPRALAGTGARLYVGGLSAQDADLSAETTSKLPIVIAIVLTLSFGYLLVAFRSLLLPLKAILLNLLATASALGITVFVFQEGHGARLLGVASSGSLPAFLPVALFALLFGLSMDYEVFLVRRMREEWQHSHDNVTAITVAMAHTARPIMAAATIMAAVFGSFLVANSLELQQIGFALAVAILLDAIFIRLLLVPAIMAIAGDANWWLPAALARRLPAARSE
jgi:putative drug exporter of the RND superfamily